MRFKHILVHDWETSGLPGDDGYLSGGQGIQYGAIIANAETLETVDVLDLNIRFEGVDGGSGWYPRLEWSMDAERIHGLSRDFLSKNGIPLVVASEVFEAFIRRHIGESEKVLTAGHNPGFDLHFTKQMLCVGGRRNHVLFHHRMIDTFSLGYMLFGAEDSNFLFREVGVVRENHNALEDAQACLDVLRSIKKIQRLTRNL